MTTEEFRQNLLDAGLLRASAVTGVYHRSFGFERVVEALEAYISASAGNKQREQIHFAPLMARADLAKGGYLASFPNLVGVLSSFEGGEAELPDLIKRVEDRREWADFLDTTDMALCGASCHHLYPMLAGTTVPDGGALFEVQAFCFRHELSLDPARMQSFRMREFVYAGSPDGALAHREYWIHHAAEILGELGLAVEIVPANDPFFGRAGKLIGAGQLEKHLKFEIVTAISSPNPGAISSGNYHEDHFGQSFHLELNDGSVAHTACFGFGLERISLALLYRHGLDVSAWPSEVRENLNLVTQLSP